MWLSANDLRAGRLSFHTCDACCSNCVVFHASAHEVRQERHQRREHRRAERRRREEQRRREAARKALAQQAASQAAATASAPLRQFLSESPVVQSQQACLLKATENLGEQAKDEQAVELVALATPAEKSIPADRQDSPGASSVPFSRPLVARPERALGNLLQPGSAPHQHQERQDDTGSEPAQAPSSSSQLPRGPA